MLGAFFGVVDQFHFCGFVVLGGSPARPGTGQRPNGDLISLRCGFLPHQNFRRRAHHLKIPHVIKIHIWTGVERTQCAVKRQGAFGEPFFDALPDLYLHEIACFNQALGALNRFHIIGLGKFTLWRVALRGFDHRCAHRVFQQSFEFAQAFFRAGVSLRGMGIGIHQERELA